MTGQQFDNVSRVVADSRLSRRSIVAMLATLIGIALTKVFGDRFLDYRKDDGTTAELLAADTPIMCDACVEATDIAFGFSGEFFEEGCVASVAALPWCPGLGKFLCVVLAAGLCAQARGQIGNRILHVNSSSVCSSSVIGDIPYLNKDWNPPCLPCNDSQEWCLATSECVPRCVHGRQSLNQATCECSDDLPDPDRSNEERYAPKRSFGTTGGELKGRWRFIVPEGQVLVVGAKDATINGLPSAQGWTLSAFEPFTPVDMTLDTGFYAVVEERFAQDFFCGQISNPVPSRPSYQATSGIPTWGNQPCLGSTMGRASSTALEQAYQSPFFGYGISWDDSWNVSRENSWWVGGPTGGFDQIQIYSGDAVFALTGTGEWDGDTGMCLEGAARGMEDWPGLSNVERVANLDDATTGRWPGKETAAVYRFNSATNGARYAYVNCVTLPSGADTMTILFAASAGTFQSHSETWEDLISRISLPD